MKKIDRIVMYGMNPRTRHLIPWDAENTEFFTLNETYRNDWAKKYDILFQIHPRWDWERDNNFADPNHPWYIKGKPGICLFCKGKAVAFKEDEEVTCPHCENGIYKPPAARKGKKVIMQHRYKDVPGSVRFPLKQINAAFFPDGVPYLTSTLAHMLAYAMYKHPEIPIELYGFEAESNTEYAVQRPGIEYLVGLGRGMGMSIEAPGAHLLRGKHYGYEDMDQGLRSRFEVRRRELQKQLNLAEIESLKAEGRLELANAFKNSENIGPVWNDVYDDHYKKKGFVTFLRATIKEHEMIVRIMDAYRQDGEQATNEDVLKLITMQYTLE